MNYFSIAILAGTLLSLVLGVLLGLARGLKRSILRLVLLALCFVLALALCSSVSESLMQIKVSGDQTIEEMLTSGLSQGGQSVTSIVVPIVQIIWKILSFIALFALLQVVSWILVYPILKLILRPLIGKRPKSRGAGALVGILCGALVAFALYVPMNGLFTEIGKIASIDLSKVSGESQSQISELEAFKKTGIADYSKSGISKFYSSLGNAFYRSLSTVTDKNGKEVILSAQIDALSAVANVATTATTLKNVVNEDGTVNTASVREFATALTELDELTPEAKQALNEMIKGVAESMGEDIPEAIKNLDPDTIDFKTEGNLLITVADVVDSEGNLENVNIEEVVDNLSKSTVILPALSESNVTLPVDEETKGKVDAAIAELENKTGDEAVDAETIAQLKALFGNGTNP